MKTNKFSGTANAIVSLRRMQEQIVALKAQPSVGTLTSSTTKGVIRSGRTRLAKTPSASVIARWA